MIARVVLLGLVCASLTLIAAAVPAVASQVHPGPSLATLPGTHIETLVAGELGVPTEQVRVALPGLEDAHADPVAADSITVRRGSGERWLLTSWREGRASVRFMRVGLIEELAVAARDLPRGHMLDQEDVTWSERVRWGSGAGPVADPVGQVTERSVRVGEPLVAPSVRPPLLVRGGEAVEALFDDGTVRMSMRGTALASARQGGRLHVRLESGRRLEAIAVDEGIVRLQMGGGS